MKNMLIAPVKFWQLLLVCVLVSVLTGTVAVSAAPLSVGLWPQGVMRMSAASDDGNNSIQVPAGYIDTVVLQKTITVPAGKKADLMVMGEVDIQTDNSSYHYQYCWGDIRMDNIADTTKVFKPGAPYMLESWGNLSTDRVPYSLSLPINGYRQNVGSGNHTIYMVMSAGYSYCNARTRSMMILMSIH